MDLIGGLQRLMVVYNQIGQSLLTTTYYLSLIA